MPKVKLTIDPRREVRDAEGRVYDDTPLDDLNSLDEAMAAAEWTDDPGTGKAVILADGRELLNPIPVAPPLHILQSQEPSVNELVERALARHFQQLQANDVIDEEEDVDDFGEDEDFHPVSQYQVQVLLDEAPAVPAAPPPGAPSVEEVVQAEAAAKAAIPPKKGKAAPPPDPAPPDGAE